MDKEALDFSQIKEQLQHLKDYAAPYKENLIGGLAGAALGGGLGAATTDTSDDKGNEARSHRIRNALTGALAGGTIGTIAPSLWNKTKALIPPDKKPKVLTPTEVTGNQIANPISSGGHTTIAKSVGGMIEGRLAGNAIGAGVGVAKGMVPGLKTDEDHFKAHKSSVDADIARHQKAVDSYANAQKTNADLIEKINGREWAPGTEPVVPPLGPRPVEPEFVPAMKSLFFKNKPALTASEYPEVAQKWWNADREAGVISKMNPWSSNNRTRRWLKIPDAVTPIRAGARMGGTVGTALGLAAPYLLSTDAGKPVANWINPPPK